MVPVVAVTVAVSVAVDVDGKLAISEAGDFGLKFSTTKVQIFKIIVIFSHD